jgi:hypothetical protein
MVRGRNVRGDDVTTDEIVQRLRDNKNRDRETYIVEKLIDPGSTITERLPIDYKVHVFREAVAAVQAYDSSLARSRYYQPNWPSFEFYFNTQGKEDILRPPPANLELLLQFGQRIGKTFETYVRVDFLQSAEGFVFGELCATPGDIRRYSRQVIDYFTQM